MMSASDSVIVSHDTYSCCSAWVVRVHHRQCPTIVAEGMSVAMAAPSRERGDRLPGNELGVTRLSLRSN